MSKSAAGHQVVIMAGGYGTRLAELTQVLPKPMVEIGGKPIMWHIMKVYAHHGISEFIICAGYKGHIIKEYFANLLMHNSDMTVDTDTGEITYHQGEREQWKVTIVDTGLATMTGGRLRRVGKYLKPEQPFLMSYGDVLGDFDIGAELEFHTAHGKLATVTSVEPPGRYGSLVLDGAAVAAYKEKPRKGGTRVSCGCYVFDPQVIEYMGADAMPLEDAPLRKLVADGELMAWPHDGFWSTMESLNDRNKLETAWDNDPPWRIWES